MEINDLDEIIPGLNKNKNVASIVQDRLEDFKLTEKEKRLIKTYKPENALIVYGTLAPNQPNHHIVEHIPGEWRKGIVRGKLESTGWGAELGYLAFNHCRPEEQQAIPAVVLTSDELVVNWPLLDEFEGEEYKRILAKYELENGEVGVGYIYATNENTE